MNNWIKCIATALGTVILATSSMAQDKKDKASKDKDEKTQEIVIRKKGNKADKMTIVIDGDNITVNGKPIDEFKNADVTVFKRQPSDRSIRRYQSMPESFGPGNFNRMLRSHSNKALLGVLTQKTDNGAKIIDVTKESGAEKAGLKKDDIITKAGDATINTPEDLMEAIGKYKPNDKVDITYLRSGKENKASVVLGDNNSKDLGFNYNNDFNFEFPKGPMPPMENFNFDLMGKPRIGMQIQDVEDGKGVKVKDVDEDSPASKAGIKEGDVITQVNGKNVSGVDDLRSEIKDLKGGDAVKLSYQRDGKNQTVEIKLPKRLKSANL